MYQQGGPFLAMRGPFITAAGSAPAPNITVGPTWTDNGNSTATVTFTADIACYGGIDYGTAPGVYTSSAFYYSTYPTLELATAHTVPVPDEGAGGTLADGTYYYRVWAGTPAGFSGYISAEQTGQISSIDPAAAAIIAACTTPPNAAAQTAINDFVVAMKAASAWTTTDSIFVGLYTGTEADALLDWKDPARSWAKVGTPTFARIGAGSSASYTNQGSADYLTSPVNFDAVGQNYAQNSAHVAINISTSVGTENIPACGAVGSDNIRIFPRRVGDVCRFFVNTATATSSGATVTNGSGFFIADRTGATATEVFRNGSSVASSAAASSAIPAATKYELGGNNTADSGNSFTYGSYGASMSANQAAINTAVQNLLTALAAAT
jgi:hypothetical protein